MEKFDAIVLGGGVSGMVAASVLSEQGKQRILLVDEYARLGGNHISLDIGEYTFDIGSFVFHDRSPFFARFPSLMQAYPPFDGSTAKINPSGKLLDYPFDLRAELLNVGPVELARIATSLLAGRIRANPDDNALQFVAYWLGDRLARNSGLISYMNRFYAAEPQLIESDFARKRMRWISSNASIKGQVARLRRRGGIPSKAIARPRSGFDAIYARVGEILRDKGVQLALGETIDTITRMPEGDLSVSGPHLAARSPVLVSTVPLPILARCCGLSCDQVIRYSSLTSLFYSFEGDRGFDKNILFNFTNDGLWKRLTMHSDCYGRVNGREYMCVEVAHTTASDNAAPFDEDFRRHTQARGLFNGDLKLEGSRKTDNAYPVYLQGATAAAAQLIAEFKRIGIVSFGRQGGFDYQPTAHVSTVIAERMLKNT